MKIRIFIGLLLLALAVPAAASANEDKFGGFTAGQVIAGSGLNPWLFGETPLPPVGCRTLYGWSTGYAPLGGYRDYRFHVSVAYCWTSGSWVVPGYTNVKGRRFVGTPKVTTEWTNARGVEYDEHAQTEIRKFTCKVDGKFVDNGCYRIKVTGQVKHPGIMGIAQIPDHPWVTFVIACDGSWLDAKHDYSPF